MTLSINNYKNLIISDPDGAIPAKYDYDDYFQSNSAYFEGWFDSEHATVGGSNASNLANRITDGAYANYHFGENTAGDGPTYVADVSTLAISGIGSGFANARPALYFNADSILTWQQPSLTTPGVFPVATHGLAIVMSFVETIASATQNILSHSSTGRHTLFRVSGTNETRYIIDETPDDIIASVTDSGFSPILLMCGYEQDQTATTDVVSLSKNGGTVSQASKTTTVAAATQLNLGGGTTTQKQLKGLVYGILHLASDPHLPANLAYKKAILSWAEGMYAVPLA